MIARSARMVRCGGAFAAGGARIARSARSLVRPVRRFCYASGSACGLGLLRPAPPRRLRRGRFAAVSVPSGAT